MGGPLLQRMWGEDRGGCGPLRRMWRKEREGGSARCFDRCGGRREGTGPLLQQMWGEERGGRPAASTDVGGGERGGGSARCCDECGGRLIYA